MVRKETSLNVRWPWRLMRDEDGVFVLNVRTEEERAGYLGADGLFYEGEAQRA